ncbi:hypothetical protein GCM10022233_02670 [Streptomyces shaanxiensis]|uniref:Uncharacterized protein n=1 Tax=Streptomyces shaanxiensis TaxID=653357 RepID=A0ABP7U8Q5_9ACTN
MAHAPSKGSRTRTASTPSRCGRGEGGGWVRRLITIKRTAPEIMLDPPGRVGRIPHMPLLTSPVLPAGTLARLPQPTLPTGDGLLLRPWRAEDAPAVHAASRTR